MRTEPASANLPRVVPAWMALLAYVALVACSPKVEGPAQASVTPTTVKLTPAQRQHIGIFTVSRAAFSQTIDAPGVVDFDNDQATSVIAPFSGPVVRILVNPGDKVAKGQPLALVQSGDFSTAVAAYSKAVAVARTNRKLADIDADLLQHNGVSAKEAAQAQTDAVSAEADRDAAAQAIVALGVTRGSIQALARGKAVGGAPGVIRSPIAGTVAERLVTPGQLVQAGTTACFTVANLSTVWVMAQIPDSDLPLLKVGDAASVTGGTGHFSGALTNISAEVNADTRTVLARVVVDNPGDLLKKQMYVRVELKSRQPSSGLLVPVAAVLRDDENLPFVFVAQQDGGFARRSVTLGERTGDSYEITGGLTDGERIVDDGGIFLQFMQAQ
jgi:membrane fusion protein, heavy metal efflux system